MFSLSGLTCLFSNLNVKKLKILVYIALNEGPPIQTLKLLLHRKSNHITSESFDTLLEFPLRTSCSNLN